MSENPVNSASWRARYIKRGGNEKGLRELFLMYERSFNDLEVLGVKWKTDMIEDCLLCGQPFGNAKFIIPFGDRTLHVCCEQDILNEPHYSNEVFIEYGIIYDKS